VCVGTLSSRKVNDICEMYAERDGWFLVVVERETRKNSYWPGQTEREAERKRERERKEKECVCVSMSYAAYC
jgi:hypothetical protein